MRLLKILVIVMGILLVIGFVVLGIAIFKKINTNAPEIPAVQTLPIGTHIVQMHVNEGVLVLWLRHKDEDRVEIRSVKDGRQIASF